MKILRVVWVIYAYSLSNNLYVTSLDEILILDSNDLTIKGLQTLWVSFLKGFLKPASVLE